MKYSSASDRSEARTLMQETGARIGKTLYGLLFMVLLPLLLYIWAGMTEEIISLPPIHSIPVGAALGACGLWIMISGMAALIVHGKGLPMNAFPPVRLVTRGIYGIIPHPIYTGFAAICIGVSIAAGSASGLWLVSPAVILGCAALVQGYEKEDLRRRFPSARIEPLLHIPSDDPLRPTAADRLSVYILVLLPWLVLYEAIRIIGVPPDALVAYLPFERNIPVIEWTEIFYASVYLFVLFAPLAARTKRDLRELSISASIATALMVLLFLSIPLIAPPRAFTPHGILGRLLEWERAYDTPAAAFPSFHVVWAFLAARTFARGIPSLRILWWSWGTLIAISCITTGMHAIIDIAAGFILFLVVAHVQIVWRYILRSIERTANSWKEWHIGPVRFINHGLYAGAGAFAGLCIVGTLLGSGAIAAMMLMGVCAMTCAALWAQWVEGSPSLLRPYGWYGGLLGATVGALLSGLFGADPWLLLAAFSVAAPWIQSAGRLRCLVQGCCHGRESSERVGIRYTHPRSRVCRLSDLGGSFVHPTPLYSILCNIVVGIAMARLWSLHVPVSLIVGLYLIMTGLGRFVEEAYRGEPQTAAYAGLRLYQWLAIATVTAGIAITMIAGSPIAPEPAMNWESIVAAGVFGIFMTLGLGLDFPNSDRRFARLA